MLDRRVSSSPSCLKWHTEGTDREQPVRTLTRQTWVRVRASLMHACSTYSVYPYVYITLIKVQKSTFTTYNRQKVKHTKGIIMCLAFFRCSERKYPRSTNTGTKLFYRAKNVEKNKKTACFIFYVHYSVQKCTLTKSTELFSLSNSNTVFVWPKISS